MNKLIVPAVIMAAGAPGLTACGPVKAPATVPPAPKPRRGLTTDAAHMRVTDQERDVVAAELSKHFQVGRLDQREFDNRLNLALKATRQIELDVCLCDLPAAV